MATPETDELERGAPRRRVLKAAQIVYNGGQTVKCMIRDISETGAKIDTEVALALPGAFSVVLPDGVRRPATLVWQKANLLGIHFTDAERAGGAGRAGGRSALIARIAEIEKQLAQLRAEVMAGTRD
jgi:hypothetical protein